MGQRRARSEYRLPAESRQIIRRILEPAIGRSRPSGGTFLDGVFESDPNERIEHLIDRFEEVVRSALELQTQPPIGRKKSDRNLSLLLRRLGKVREAMDRLHGSDFERLVRGAEAEGGWRAIRTFERHDIPRVEGSVRRALESQESPIYRPLTQKGRRVDDASMVLAWGVLSEFHFSVGRKARGREAENLLVAVLRPAGLLRGAEEGAGVKSLLLRVRRRFGRAGTR